MIVQHRHASRKVGGTRVTKWTQWVHSIEDRKAIMRSRRAIAGPRTATGTAAQRFEGAGSGMAKSGAAAVSRRRHPGLDVPFHPVAEKR